LGKQQGMQKAGRRSGKPCEADTSTTALCSFDQVYHLYYKPVFGYIMQLTQNNWDLAEEITQETFLRAWQSWNTVNRPWQIKAWLYRTASHVFIDAYRRDKRKGRLNAIPLQVVADELLSDGYQDDPQEHYDTRETICQALALLPFLERRVLILAQEEYTYQEISEMLHITLPTVRMRLHRARQDFRCYYCELDCADGDPISSTSERQQEWGQRNKPEPQERSA
jgi:RNA polymerase sigma-70 factor (ECF subfamily)